MSKTYTVCDIGTGTKINMMSALSMHPPKSMQMNEPASVQHLYTHFTQLALHFPLKIPKTFIISIVCLFHS